jgi:microsomal dipeptidase-like Zn-dependent dipeptidase
LIARILSRLLSVALALVVIAFVGFFTVGGSLADWRENKVADSTLAPPSDSARALHSRLTIIDLHADPLLWPRSLVRKSSRGHVDVPRLIEGHVAVQVLSAVTKVPAGLNYERNTADKDRIGLLAAASGWPASSWTRLMPRAAVQAEKLGEFATRSRGRLVPVRSAAELDLFLRFRARGDSNGVAAILAMEGLQALQGNLARLDTLFSQGYRIGGLVHFFDNEVGGASAGEAKGGLTDFGRQVIARMEELGMIVDLAHASPQLISDVLAVTKKPVIVSHTGVQGTCPGPRNLSDDALRGIAAKGGVVGIGYWDAAVCDITPKGIAKAIRYAVTVAGINHVGLGSDFDGATTTLFDTSQLVLVTDALLQGGFTPAEIEAIMGGNALRVLRAGLPAK